MRKDQTQQDEREIGISSLACTRVATSCSPDARGPESESRAAAASLAAPRGMAGTSGGAGGGRRVVEEEDSSVLKFGAGALLPPSSPRAAVSRIVPFAVLLRRFQQGKGADALGGGADSRA